MSSENSVNSSGGHFEWDPVSKTVRAVNPSGNNPNVMDIGPEDVKFFGQERRN